MKLAILLIVGGIGLLCVTGYLAYVDFGKSVFSFFRSPQHYRINQAAKPRKELRFSRKKVDAENLTEDEKLARKTLRIFNGVRSVVASGRIDVIKDFLDSFGIFKKINIPLGPAANMMKMQWNGTMEQIVKAKLNESSFTGQFTDLFTSVEFDGYHSFAWIGSINEAIDAVTTKLGLSQFDGIFDQIKAHSEIVEYIIALVYLAIKYPGNINIAGKHLGPAAALVASRHQIGCSKSKTLFYSICIVKADNATELYEEGVTCYSCPKKYSSCEWRVQPDNTMMEADLCVLHANFTGEEADDLTNSLLGITTMDPSSSSTPISSICFLIVCFILLLKNKYI